MKKKNIFLVYSEYHLMFAISVIFQKYSKQEDYDNLIILSKNHDKSRLNAKVNANIVNAIFHKIEVGEMDFSDDKKDILFLRKLTEKRADQFITFLENSLFNYYLSYKLSKNGTHIVLAQDGTKPYKDIVKNTIKSQLLYTAKMYLMMLRKGLVINFFQRTRDDIYAYTTLVKELWLSHPHRFNNRTNKALTKIDIFPNQQIVEKLLVFFCFDEKSGLLNRKNILFYLNHPVYNEKIYEFELEQLDLILEQFPGKLIYIKLHPLTPKSQINAFSKKERIVLNRSQIPAELFIASLSNSIIFSLWSTSLLIENESCNYYWLYKMLDKLDMINYIKISNPSDHVITITELDEMKFK